MNPILFLIDFILHIDVHLGQLIAAYGLVIYVILFAIVFIETGLVFIPFLPGDSLLFAAGALAAIGSLNLGSVLVLLTTAAILGDTCNYWIGHSFGRRLVENPKVPISREHLEETESFFERHGGKTIILARFVPFVRTFAPFVAGIGKMTYTQFLFYNVVGALAWVFIVTLAGFFFGNIPFVKENFSIIILAIILISVIPVVAPTLAKRVKRILQKV